MNHKGGVLEKLHVSIKELPSPLGAITFYNIAQELNKQENPIAIEYFDQAASLLEQALLKVPVQSNGRKSLLEKLGKCYQKLCVESCLPDELKRVTLSEDWPCYIRRATEISKELEGYKA